MELNQYLKNFLDHYNFLTSTASGEDDDQLVTEYKSLREAGANIIADAKRYPRTAGSIAVNRSKNRYKDIIPFDSTRVKITPQSQPNDGTQSDYINANYIQGIHGNQAYIASQAPLPHTVNDFWLMVWQTEAKVILMACNEYEGRKLKCTRYWPVEEKHMQFGEIRVTLKSLDERDNGDFLVRRLQVDKDGENRTVMQYHYTAWPDHGIPSNVTPILDTLSSARVYQSTDELPIIVHCSAGCGRTGTLIVIDYVWNLLKHNMITKDISVLDIMVEMRKQRQSLVQTSDQYEVVYRAIIQLFQRQIQNDQNMYENVTADQHKARKDRFKQSLKKSADYVEEVLSSLTVEEPSAPSTDHPPSQDANSTTQLSAPPRAKGRTQASSMRDKKGQRPQANAYENTANNGLFKQEQLKQTAAPQKHSDAPSEYQSEAKIDRPNSLDFNEAGRKTFSDSPAFKKPSATIILGKTASQGDTVKVKPPIVPKPSVKPKPSIVTPSTPSGSDIREDSLYAVAGDHTATQPSTQRVKQFTEAKPKSMDIPASPAKLRTAKWKSADGSSPAPCSGHTSSTSRGAMYHIADEVASIANAGKEGPSNNIPGEGETAKQVAVDGEYAYVDVTRIHQQARYSDTTPTQYSLQSDLPSVQYSLQGDISNTQHSLQADIEGGSCTDDGEVVYSLQGEDDDDGVAPPPVPLKRYTDDDEDYSPVELGAKIHTGGGLLNGKNNRFKLSSSPLSPTTPGSTMSSHGSSTGSNSMTLRSFGAAATLSNLFDKMKPKGKLSGWSIPSATSNQLRRDSNTSYQDEIMFKGMNMGFPHRTKRVSPPTQSGIPPASRR